MFLSRLTQRQFEMVECVAHGMTTKQIAAKLSISERTTESTIYTIYERLDLDFKKCSKRAMLAAYYWQDEIERHYVRKAEEEQAA